MTQSAGQIEAEPTACPFVALEHDRDARSPLPDARHRCYAEQVPAPRTIAHQERYCLSPSFAQCPIFAEWAVRAAAQPIPGTGAAAVAVAADPAPELWVERFDKGIQPARDQHWPDSMDAAGPAAAAAAIGGEGDSETDAQQLAAFETPATAPADAPEEPLVDEPPLGATALLVPAAGARVADRATVADAVPVVDADRGFDPAPLPTFLNARSPRGRSSAPASFRDDSLAAVPEPNVRGPSGRRDGDNEGAFARLLTLAAVIIILALGVATVLIVPGLLAGHPGQTTRPSLIAGASRAPSPLSSGLAVMPSSSADATVPPASDAPVPAATPTPTPRSYKVQPGDSLRRIARQFGVTVADILAANPTIPDADHVEVGQRLVIPAP